MNLQSLPDIAGMIVLMAVLDALRRKHRESSVDLWMLGLLFILLETLAVAVLHGSPALYSIAHALALDSYVLAGVTFGWAARRDVSNTSSATFLANSPTGLSSGQGQLPLFLPPAVPLFALTTLYGFNSPPGETYLAITTASLIAGVLYVLLSLRGSARFKSQLLVFHLVLWMPMVWMAYIGQLRPLVYWGLAFLYGMVALSFRNRVREGGVGGRVIVSGFSIWALCFLVHPLVRDRGLLNDLNEQIWTMQKFFVIIGMLLLLLEQQRGRLEQEAMHDALTGLPNRRLFDDRLRQAMALARRSGRSAALFVVDLDNFKIINDSLGHRTGDLVLQQVAHVLKTKIRGSDTLARCGGDEFNVIITGLSRPSDCEKIADVLRDAVASVEAPAGVRIAISASVGYALFPDDVSDAAELTDLADVRMYRDKRQNPAQMMPHAVRSQTA